MKVTTPCRSLGRVVLARSGLPLGPSPVEGWGGTTGCAGAKSLAGEDLPGPGLRRRRGDQAGQGTVAAVCDGDGEFDGVADAQDVGAPVWAGQP